MRLLVSGLLLALLLVAGAAVLMTGTLIPRVEAPRAVDSARPTATSDAQPQAADLPPLKISPDKGIVGSTFTVRVEGIPAGKKVDFEWGTWDGDFALKTMPETVQYQERKFTPKRVPLVQAQADQFGVVEATATAPEDYGEVHEIFAVVDGKDVARGGFRVQMSASISPTEGPIGTPVTITVTGMGAMLYSGATLALRYDNAYTGILTATSTRGTARAEIRAAGPVGQHLVILNAGTVPAYLNIQQSPYDYVYAHLPDKEDIRLPFTVTRDAGPPPDTIEWPDPERVQQLQPGAPVTTRGSSTVSGVSATFDKPSGPIRSRPTLTVRGLSSQVAVDAYWVTARGNRVTPSGWALADLPLFTATPGGDGALSHDLEVPDDLGGWHVVKLVQAGKIIAEAPYYVERSLEGVSAHQVKAGDTVVIQLKGIGWTELDNGFAMTYDNAFVGYACGFNSNGDVTLQVPATGGPGTHLIDLYPMVYAGKDKKAWYWTPVLTFAQDFPALQIGYRIPAYRLAIEIKER